MSAELPPPRQLGARPDRPATSTTQLASAAPPAGAVLRQGQRDPRPRRRRASWPAWPRSRARWSAAPRWSATAPRSSRTPARASASRRTPSRSTRSLAARPPEALAAQRPQRRAARPARRGRRASTRSTAPSCARSSPSSTHLTRLLGGDGEDGGYRPPGEPGANARHPRPRRPPAPRRALDLAGLDHVDPVLQRTATRALRGAAGAAGRARRHRAQHRQRETQGYSRQEAVFSAPRRRYRAVRRARRTAPAPSSARASTSSATAACATTSSTCSSAPRAWRSASSRRRPSGLDAASRTCSPSRATPASASCSQVLELLGRRWPTTRRAPPRQAAVRRRSARPSPTASTTLDSRPRPACSARPPAQYADAPRPATAPCKPMADEIAQLNVAIKQATAARRAAQRPARPPRPAARQAVASRPGLGRPTTSATAPHPASASAAPRTPLVDARPPSTCRRRDARPAPGGQLGGLQDRRRPGGTIAGYRPTSTAIAASLDTSVNAVYGRRRSSPAPTPRRSRSPRPSVDRQRRRRRCGRRRQRVAARRRRAARRHGRPALRRLRAPASAPTQADGHRTGDHRQRSSTRHRRAAPVRHRRLDGRGDDQHGPLPARLPGRRARHVDHGRDARHPHQPHRHGSGCSHARHQEHDRRPTCWPTSSARDADGRARRSRSPRGKRITQPSDDAARHPATPSRLPRRARGLAQYSATTRRGATAGSGHRRALQHINDVIQRARELTVQGANGTTEPRERKAIAAEIDQLINAAKDAAERHVPGRHVRLLGHRQTTKPRRTAPPRPTTPPMATPSPSCGTLGPGVSVRSTPPGSVLGGPC